MLISTAYSSSASSTAPLRGTQSLVGVMAFVWKRPALTGLELLWRELTAMPLIWLAWLALGQRLAEIPVSGKALGDLTFFDPVHSVAVLAATLQLYLPAVTHAALWLGPLALLLSVLLSGWGRTTLLRRADPALKSRFLVMLRFRFLRTLAFFGLLALWLRSLMAALNATIIAPGRHGGEPNVVLCTAAAVALTLAAFMIWSLTVWLLDLPPLLAMTGLQLGAEIRSHLRAKLIETNLVMGIVRVALFVLAMTFSASPLPFQTQETQAYIDVWWVGVAIFYVVSSAFFHVVRYVTYLRLLESLATPTNADAQSAS